MRELVSARYRHLKNYGRSAVATCLPFPAGVDDSVTGGNTPGRIATLSASLLTLIAISFASLGLWDVGADLDQAGHFVFRSGFLSHWQVWIGAAVATQYAGVQLARYAKTPQCLLDDSAIEEISVALPDESATV